MNNIEHELIRINRQIDDRAALAGLPREKFLNALSVVDPLIANEMVPLLKRKIELLKSLWSQSNSKPNNLVLFTRTR